MGTQKDNQLASTSNNQPSAPLLRGPLTKRRLMALPRQPLFLISNGFFDPDTPVLECELTEEMSRASLWREMVKRRVNGRMFYVFAEKESLLAEKDERRNIVQVRLLASSNGADADARLGESLQTSRRSKDSPRASRHLKPLGEQLTSADVSNNHETKGDRPA
jgi:hypothetical protein